MERTGGCRREHLCDYSHDTIKTESSKTRIIGFKCVSCKSAWSENKFVVEHTVNQTKVYFCLNCEDWVKDKKRVLDNGWTLFDRDGYLKYDV